MNKITEAMNTDSAYYLLHAATGMIWGAALVMVHISMTTAFWTINTFITLAWTVLMQGGLVLFYRKKERSMLKGMALIGATMVTILVGTFIMVPY